MYSLFYNFFDSMDIFPFFIIISIGYTLLFPISNYVLMNISNKYKEYGDGRR